MRTGMGPQRCDPKWASLSGLRPQTRPCVRAGVHNGPLWEIPDALDADCNTLDILQSAR